jgi:hypothetical protein
MSVQQQINLFQPVMGEVRQPLSAKAFAIGLASVLVGLVGVTVLGQVEVNRLDAQAEVLRAQAAQQQDVLSQLGEFMPDSKKPTASELIIKKMTGDLKARQRALEVLRAGAAGQAIGFAARMEALARRHTDGVWLEHMQLSGVSGAMSLSGVALNPSSVPQYLQQLSSETALAGTRFDEFVIQRPDATSAQAEDGEAIVKKTHVPASSVRFRAASQSGKSQENPS